MKTYSSKISLNHNDRGVYSLDTSIGCGSGLANNPKGCYNDCYAAKSAKLYGYDFSKTVYRDFENHIHLAEIKRQINNSKLDFIRIGSSGDPSENWNHTVSIIKKIDKCNKEIVIITKHWTNLSDKHLEYFRGINVCINTSVSALDNPGLLNNSLIQYHRIKKYCKSVLRVVTANFNLDNDYGKAYSEIQNELIKTQGYLDTVLRVNKSNPLLKNGIINAKRGKFLGKNTLISKNNKKTYLGKCITCKEMCGIEMSKHENYPNKLGIIKQLNLF